MRKFEFISKEQWEKDLDVSFSVATEFGYKKPTRGTKRSAGYDFTSPIEIIVPAHETALIPTGIKVTMEDDEVLLIVPRSGIGFKTNIRLSNTLGVIDADYYNNPQNEGHMMIKFYNPTDKPFHINVGDRIAQGIFIKYLTVDDEDDIINERTGGFGSTGIQ